MPLVSFCCFPSLSFFSCLSGAAVRRRTRDQKVAGSTPGRGAMKSTMGNSAFEPSGVDKSSTSLHGWGLAGRVHLCRVAGNTV